MQGTRGRAITRPLRRLLALSAAVASIGILGTAGAPSGAGVTPVVSGSGKAYTIEVQIPDGLPSRCRLSTVDLATGVVTPVGSFADDQLGCSSDLAFSPGGVLYGISDVGKEFQSPSVEGSTPSTVEPAVDIDIRVHLVRYDTTTGAVTDLGAIGASSSYTQFGGGITFDPTGKLYVYMVGYDTSCQHDAYCLYEVDPANPANATFLGADPEETYLYGLTTACGVGMYTVEDTLKADSIEPAEDVLSIRGGNQLDAVNPTPPAKATAVGGLIGRSRSVQSIDFATDGTLWALGSTTPLGSLVRAQLSVLDRTTGAQTMGHLLTTANQDPTLAVGLAITNPSCPVEIQPSFTG